jgi:hypothetical protein
LSRNVHKVLHCNAHNFRAAYNFQLKGSLKMSSKADEVVIEQESVHDDVDAAPAKVQDKPAKLGFGALVMKQLIDFKNGLTMTGGDFGALAQLFFDNLSTLLGALFAIQEMIKFGAPASDVDAVIWGRIVPGVGLTLMLGNMYYTWQAIRVTNSCGRPYTAQPYGLNTPAAFAFVFNIMCEYSILNE